VTSDRRDSWSQGTVAAQQVPGGPRRGRLSVVAPTVVVMDQGREPTGEQADEQDVGAAADLAQAVAAIAALQTSPTLPLNDTELRDLVAGLHRARSRLDAAYLHALRALDTRDGVLPGVSARIGATFLVEALNVSRTQARRDVAAASALDADGAGVAPENADRARPADLGLPRLGAALAAGQVSLDHVRVVVRALERLPRAYLDHLDDDGASGATQVDTLLTEHAMQFDPPTLDRIARHLVVALDPDRQDRLDPGGIDRRCLTLHHDPDGSLHGRFRLDPAAAAVVRAAVDAYAAPRPAVSEDEHILALPDDRTPAQRRADALTTLCRNALRGGDAAGTSAQVTIVATLDQLAAAIAAQPTVRDHHTQRRPDGAPCADGGAAGLAHDLGAGGGPVHASVLGRLLCDASLTALLTDTHGAPLRLGRDTRLASRAQRRALAARDRGCIVPGCAAPPAWCEAHHLCWWRHDGRTDIDNLVLLCQTHHTLVHTGTWRIAMIDGLPWLVPPPWIDPDRRPLRRHVPTAEDDAARLGDRLRISRDRRRRRAA